MNLHEIQQLVYKEYIKNGYLDEWTAKDKQQQFKNDIAELGLFISEIGEAMEACRDFNLEALGYELADIIIRVLNFASRNQIDIESKIISKNQKNLKRGKLHGRNI